MTLNSHGNRPTKNERREQAREKARELRLEAQKKERKRKVVIQLSVILGIVVVAAIVALSIITSIPKPGPRPANMASDGILLQAKLDAEGKPTGEIEAVLSKPLPDGANPVTTTQDPSLLNIVTYIDFQCPVCKSFEEADSSLIEERVRNGAATLEVHPVAILDRMSLDTRYSSRAANAAACVATYDPDNFLAFMSGLYADQPAENSGGLGNDQIKAIAEKAGLADLTDINKCIDDETYKAWVTAATERAKAANPLPNSTNVTFSGTPTVIVNGQEFVDPTLQAIGKYSPDVLAAFLLKLSSLSSSTSTPTPTPSN